MKLTKHEQAILVFISDGPAELNTGTGLMRRMRKAGFDSSPQGCHLTAASLVRKRLVSRIPAVGYNHPVRYEVNGLGKAVLAEARARYLSEHPVPVNPGQPGPEELRRRFLVGGRR